MEPAAAPVQEVRAATRDRELRWTAGGLGSDDLIVGASVRWQRPIAWHFGQGTRTPCRHGSWRWYRDRGGTW